MNGVGVSSHSLANFLICKKAWCFDITQEKEFFDDHDFKCGAQS